MFSGSVVANPLLLIAGVPIAASTGYLAFLTLLSRRIAVPKGDVSTTFDVIVPAHNESVGIVATVASLRAMQYPASQFRILVVADNCTDDTAERASAAGATVLVRQHATEKGKGYALAHAYAASLADGFASAVVVVDADTSVTPNLLTAFSARFAAGASAVQAEYGVRNAQASWRTRLMVIALTLFHGVRSLGRERLGVSCGLRGNGMGFSVATIRRVPPRAFSIVEDVEYGVALGLEGLRVVYVPEAQVFGDMPETGAASRTQRERWESGRLAMAREHVPRLLRAASPGRRAIALDLAADLLVMPLTTLVALTGLGLLISLLLVWNGAASAIALLPWAFSALALLMYIIRGAVLSGAGLRVVFDLMWAPVFAIWKIALLLNPTRQKGEWVRTTRPDDR
jgi:1,2-diacylglycerol 3-beta-glucosyltransferase